MFLLNVIEIQSIAVEVLFTCHSKKKHRFNQFDLQFSLSIFSDINPIESE